MDEDFVLTKEQQRILDNQTEQHQRNAELYNAWMEVRLDRIEKLYLFAKYYGGIMVYHDHFLGALKIRGNNSALLSDDQTSTVVSCGDASGWQMGHVFFGTPLAFKGIKCAWPERADPFRSAISKFNSRFPPELRLIILSHLPLHDWDVAIRLNYPQLLPNWISKIPERYQRLSQDLCTTENMDYVRRYYPEYYATSDNDQSSHTVDFYLLRSLDLHPKEKIRLSEYLYLTPEQQAQIDKDGLIPPVDEFSLIDASANLSRNLERLYKYTKRHHLEQAHLLAQAAMQKSDMENTSNLGLWDTIFRLESIQSSILPFCQTCSDLRGSRPFMIPLSFRAPSHERKATETAVQFLLMFEDELVEIFKNMEVAYRPWAWLNHQALSDGTFDVGVNGREIADWMTLGCQTIDVELIEHDWEDLD
ncbi:hypothetical protein BKA65DRAFT_472028 [Rhexocercosporidium sp. MPI-PUGE-AT-0058]|nr:hypothetical protein BKA65DRAFT_472028 [Rhexocercosporidium sp. MPI-PUGE-AT-0058]